ncbi:hypothetical protein LMH87_006299 [Akanthomyces muscarius]|uniref:Uncharacterized protein n=1 Tax=Akanthomyces muscarius TaxID=2231603 RepID=A0A9W8URD7_AKAMU|nr:hypothetical protein LMH87_006299 [Akanthomyces muscarius]KAJ4164636.1 hypothetical protein LMH87_006299 [Akanthomyces muscarius]
MGFASSPLLTRLFLSYTNSLALTRAALPARWFGPRVQPCLITAHQCNYNLPVAWSLVTTCIVKPPE